MTKKTKGITYGVIAVAIVATIVSSDDKDNVESIELSVQNLQVEYDINTNIPVEIIISPADANAESIEYVVSSDSLTFSDDGIFTGDVEGSFDVYVVADDVTSNTISINVVDITAREYALAEAEAQQNVDDQSRDQTTGEDVPTDAEQATPELEVSKIEEPATESDTAAPQTSVEQPESPVVQQSPEVNTPVEEPSTGGVSDSSGNGSNFNTYDNASQQQTEDTYVLNTSRMKIHHPTCSSVPKIAPQNYATSNATLDELLAQGYTTCGNCFD